MGFFERARMKVIGPVPERELDRLDTLCPFTAAERAMVTKWSDPPPLIGEARRAGEPARTPAGMGKFILKYGGSRHPGIPVQLHLTDAERDSAVHDTNTRFSELTHPDPGESPTGTAQHGTPRNGAAVAR